MLDPDPLSLGAPRVLMLKVALVTVLLEVWLFSLTAHQASKLIDRVVKLPVHVAPLHAEVATDELHAIELLLDLVNARDIIAHYRIVSTHWLAEGEALVDMLHDLLLAFHRYHAGQHKVEINAVLVRHFVRVLGLFFAIKQVWKGIAENRLAAVLNARIEIVAIPVFKVRILDRVFLLPPASFSAWRF